MSEQSYERAMLHQLLADFEDSPDLLFRLWQVPETVDKTMK